MRRSRVTIGKPPVRVRGIGVVVSEEAVPMAGGGGNRFEGQTQTEGIVEEQVKGGMRHRWHHRGARAGGGW